MNKKEQESNWGVVSKEEAALRLKTDLNQGLNNTEVLARQKKYGFNELPKKKQTSALSLFLSQFASVIIWLLIGAILIAAFLGEWVDTIAIAAIVFLNACLGFFQEYKAERSLEALQKLAEPKAHVIRDGKIETIAARELVLGDLVLLEEGDSIPADGRMIQASHFATQESLLTGESLPVDKTDAPLSSNEQEEIDRTNGVFMGTSVARGRGKMLVTATGLQTELGKIADLLQKEKKQQTPLQIKLNVLGNRLTWICLAIVLIVFGAGVWRGSSFGDSLLIAISLAVAAIPEGLPAVVTIALALGVRKMAKYNALVRRLPSVETLGCTTVICTDKTGTLTQNEMSVNLIWLQDGFVEVQGVGYEPSGTFEKNQQRISPKDDPELLWILTVATLCNHAELYQENGEWKIRGDPTEAALLVAAKKAGLEKTNLETQFPLKEEFPFDSDRKLMSTVRAKEGEYLLFTKGALDAVLERSDKIMMKGKEVPLTDSLREQIQHVNTTLTDQALRVLAFAYRPLGMQTSFEESLEQQLTFVGLIAMLDPLRPEVKQAIQVCHQAGIHIVMITGDHPNTAAAIGKELDLLTQDKRLIHGKDLEQLDEGSLKKQVEGISIYARTSARFKLMIVRAWKELGEIVAMTGDGVNDAPAIKEANIGLSMGLKGTDVAREASDIVILDDHFATIVHAIREGRGIFDNILKFVTYLITCNVAELLIIFASLIFDFRDAQGNPFVALTAVQLLWLNLVTDGLPAIALSMDPVDPRAMQRPPRKPDAPILSLRSFLHLFAISLVIALGGLIGCFYGLQTSPLLAYTMTFTILVVLELVIVQMVRAHYHMKMFSNRLVLIALASSFLLQLLVIYVPFLQTVFNTTPLGFLDWGIIATIGVAVYLLGTLINRLFDTRQAFRI